MLSLRLVNKQFHAFLSAKSSEPIWKAARVRAGLADIDDFTEMQYAELLFGKTCQGCYGDKVGKIYRDFYLRKNFCKRCRRLKIVNAARLGQEAPDVAALLHPLAVKCVLRTTREYGVCRTAAWNRFADPGRAVWPYRFWHTRVVSMALFTWYAHACSLPVRALFSCLP